MPKAWSSRDHSHQPQQPKQPQLGWSHPSHYKLALRAADSGHAQKGYKMRALNILSLKNGTSVYVTKKVGKMAAMSREPGADLSREPGACKKSSLVFQQKEHSSNYYHSEVEGDKGHQLY